MVYKRYPYLHRNYYYTEPKPPRDNNTEQLNNNKLNDIKTISKEKVTENVKLVEDIPMPNEKENIPDPEITLPSGSRSASTRRKDSRFSLSKFLPEKLNFDDILILGVIFLLLYEEKRDDMLLVALLYLLL